MAVIVIVQNPGVEQPTRVIVSAIKPLLSRKQYTLGVQPVQGFQLCRKSVFGALVWDTGPSHPSL